MYWYDGMPEDEPQPWPRARITSVQTQNEDGDWVPSIPEPYYWWVGRWFKMCYTCRRIYFTMAGYRGHYALRHILRYKEK